MASSSNFGFSQCVFYALSQLQMADISFKKEQHSSMEAICNGHDVFVWLPTGYGTSLRYQTLPFIMDCKQGLVGSQERSLVLAVSPLIALMVDQVTSLRKRGVNCSARVKSIESTYYALLAYFTPQTQPTLTCHVKILLFKLHACTNSVYQAFSRMKAWV